MKTWQRIFIVTVLLGIGTVVGFNRLIQGQRNNMLSVSNLKMIGIAWTMYADDNNDKLPDLSDPQSMKNALVRYLAKGSERAFVHPKTRRPYLPNSSLSYKERREFNAPSTIAVVYEDEPASDGTRGVLFEDNHVERVSESRWLELKKSSNIP